jgi:hypothetical protein
MEQPNMLAQMGQMMQLRQMQQGYESENALRDFYAKGGDLSTAEGKRQVMSLSPSAGMKLIGQQSEISARDIGTAEKSLAMLKNQAGLVKTPQDAANWLSSFYRNPLTRPYVEAVAPMDQALAAIPTDPAALQGWLRNASLKADQIFESADAQLAARTRIQAAGISAAPGHRQADLAREKFNLEQTQQNEVNRILRGEAPTTAAPTTAPATTGGPTAATPVGAGSVPTGASAPTAAPATAPTNALAPTGAPAAPANALVALTGDVYSEIDRLDAQIRQLAGSGNPKALEAARVLNSQRNALLQSAQQQYGGPMVDMEVTDPATGQRTTVKGQRDQYGRLVPVEMGAIPLSTNASVTGGTTISPTVARPAPTAAVIKERQAIEKLPEAIAMNTDAIRKIDEMIGAVDAKGNPLPGTAGKPHPGFTGAVGAGFGTRFIPGTDAKAFEIRHKEVLSQAFLDAFEALKGGGAITEKEGEKATAARTRMDLAQNEKEYMAAAREYQGVLKRGIENARAKIQRSGGGSAENADPLGIRK